MVKCSQGTEKNNLNNPSLGSFHYIILEFYSVLKEHVVTSNLNWNCFAATAAAAGESKRRANLVNKFTL
jgi:hypothetical protein